MARWARSLRSISRARAPENDRIGCKNDSRILRLIQKWLKAGISEDGQWSESNVATPQGAVVSRLLSQLYLH